MVLLVLLWWGDLVLDIYLWGWQFIVEGMQQCEWLCVGICLQCLVIWLVDGLVDEDWLDGFMDDWCSVVWLLVKCGLVEWVVLVYLVLVVSVCVVFVFNFEQVDVIVVISVVIGFVLFLFDGVIGSGKIEVYLQVIVICLVQGWQVLVLVLEIGFILQILLCFCICFGILVYVLYLGLNDNECVCVWVVVVCGEVQIIVGMCLVVFILLFNVGLIVVDEEYDGSYKQQDGICYYVCDFVLVCVKVLDVLVVLGSVMLLLELLYNVQVGCYMYLCLKQWVGEVWLLCVWVLDVCKWLLCDGLLLDVLDGIV